MAWEISVNKEGLVAIRDSLQVQTKKWLISCIRAHDKEKKVSRIVPLRKVSKTDLADIVFGIVLEINTCNNGGFMIWADSKGWMTFHIDSAKAWVDFGNRFWRNHVKDGENYTPLINTNDKRFLFSEQ